MRPSAGGARPLDHHFHHHPHDLHQHHDYQPHHSQPTRRHAAQPSISKPYCSVPTTLATTVDSRPSPMLAPLQRRLSSIMAGTSAKQRAWRSRLSTVSRMSSNLLLVVFLAVLAISPAAAVRLPIQNCLDESYRRSENHPLQWLPLEIDAVFDTQNDNHRLQVIVWGNVTGSQNPSFDPPAAGDPYWTDKNETVGKIIRSANPDSKNAKATTLIRSLNFLSYEPFRDPVDFCTEGLANASCPLSPIFDTTNMYGSSLTRCCNPW